MFLVSPDFAASTECAQELEYADQLNVSVGPDQHGSGSGDDPDDDYLLALALAVRRRAFLVTGD